MEYYFYESYPFHYHSYSRYILPPWMEVIIKENKVVGVKNSYDVDLDPDVGEQFKIKLETYFYTLKFKECE